MTDALKHDAAAPGSKQESRRTHLHPDHPARKTVPRGNGKADAGEVRRSLKAMHTVLGH